MTDKLTWPARDRLIEWLTDEEWGMPREDAETFCDLVEDMILDTPLKMAELKRWGCDVFPVEKEAK